MSKLPLALGALLLFALAVLTTLHHETFLRRDLPELGDVPSFQLIDDRGSRFDSSAALHDKVWVANLFLTSCTGPCPIISGKIARMSRIFTNSPSIRFVSISVDPEVDRPERLRAYRSRFDAHQENWILLTGEEAAIQKIAEDGFKLGLPGEPALHSTRLVLVDRRGRIRGYYSGSDDKELQTLVNDLNAVLHEQPPK